MNSRHRHQNPFRRQLSRQLHTWHRRIGACGFLFIIWMVISGWLLNHTDRLGMDHIPLRYHWLTQWYGLDITMPSSGFFTKNHWMTNTADDQLVIDGKLLKDKHLHAIGMAQQNGIVAIAGTDNVLLLDSQAQPIEMLGGGDLPIKNMSLIGNSCQGIAISDGEKVFTTVDGLEWSACTNAANWSHSQALNKTQTNTLLELLAPSISMEKVIIDLHTGRFFGPYGAWFVDLVGLALLTLAGSGLWMYFRHTKLQRKHRQRQ